MTQSKTKQLDPVVEAKIDQLDLSLCEERLQDLEAGEGWTKEQARYWIGEYRHFLKLVALGGMVRPHKMVDLVWHTCILDTKEYVRSCKYIFGKYIHHMPYLGKEELDQAWKNSVRASEKVLGRE